MPQTDHLTVSSNEVLLGDRIYRVIGSDTVFETQRFTVRSIKIGRKYLTFTGDGAASSVRVPRGGQVVVQRETPTEEEQRDLRDQDEIALLQHLLQNGLDEEQRLRNALHRWADSHGPFLDHGDLHDLLIQQHRVRFFQRVQTRLEQTAPSRDIVDAFAWVIHQITRAEGYDNPLSGATSLTVRLERDLETYTARRFLHDLDRATVQQDTILHRRLHQLQERGN